MPGPSGSGGLTVTAAQDAEGRVIGPMLYIPPTGINVPAGTTSLQALINANPNGTTFYFDAWTTYHISASAQPKTGNTFIGQTGTRLTGDDVTEAAFLGFSGGSSGVTFRNLVLEHFVTSGINNNTLAAIKMGDSWTVENCEFAWNGRVGLWPGSGAVIRFNNFHHNGQYGFGGGTANMTIASNEIAFNNFGHAFAPDFDAGGCKLVRASNTTLSRNYSHDNYGVGLWTDTDNQNITYEYNRVEDNAGMGILHEISLDAVIHRNTLKRNGSVVVAGKSLFYGGDLCVSTSSNVDVYGNVVETPYNGISVVYDSARGTSGVTGVAFTTANVTVRDNDVVLRTGGLWAAGLVGGHHSGFGNAFTRNTYHVPNLTSTWWQWAAGARTKAQWQSDGQDTAGLFQTVI